MHSEKFCVKPATLTQETSIQNEDVMIQYKLEKEAVSQQETGINTGHISF